MITRRDRWPRSALFVATLVLLISPFAVAQNQPEIDSDAEAVTFYPTYGYQRDGEWIIPMRIWVHEPPNAIGNMVADAARGVIAEHAGLDALTASQEQRFARRIADFIADSESSERVMLMFDNDPHAQRFQMRAGDDALESDRNGLIEAELSLS